MKKEIDDEVKRGHLPTTGGAQILLANVKIKKAGRSPKILGIVGKD
jgi:hypothetical protein